MKPKKIQNWHLILLLVIISFSLYANSLSGDFIIDDTSGIVNKERLHDPKIFFSEHLSIRPAVLLDIVYVFNWYIGSGSPFPFHLFNVLVHAGCVILIFLLCNVLFNNRNLSFLASLIFAVHPIHTEAISWISGGQYAFSSLFFIASLIFYIKSDKSIYNLSLAVVFFSFCFLSGNTVASLPVVFVLYDIFFRERNPENKTLRKFRMLVLLLLLAIAVIFVGFYFLKRDEFIHLIFYFRGFKYLAVSAKAFLYYLRILYLPVQRGLYHPFAFNTTGIQEISPALFVSIGVIVSSVVLFFKCRKNFKPISFGIMWFFVTYAPYSNVIPVCNIVSERYLYLPSVGFSIIVAFLFLKVWVIINKSVRYQKVLRVIAIIVIVLFLSSYAVLTIKQNYEYNNIITYWESNIRNFPEGHMFYNNLAGTFYAMGDLENAKAYCWVNLIVNPSQPNVWCNLGKLYREGGDLKQARDCYQQALEIDKSYFPALKVLEEIKNHE